MSNFFEKLFGRGLTEIPCHPMHLGYKDQNKRGIKTLERHFGDEICVYAPEFSDEDFHVVSEDKLRKGELSAVVYKAGSYAIRDAQVLYRDDDECGYNNRVPADDEKIAEYKAMDSTRKSILGMEGCRKVREIRVAYRYAPQPKWKFVCMSATAKDYSWYEQIDFIGTAKRNIFTSDKNSDLFILVDWMGSSFSTETWYRLSCDGSAHTYQIHPYDAGAENRKWEW